MTLADITRSIKTTVVVDGDVYVLTSSAATLATGGNNALANDALVFSQAAFGKIYFVDGTNYKVFDPSSDTVSTWTASNGGTLPISGSDTARLICLWGGRIVLAGVAGDEHNYFMSEQGDPLDFDYSPATITDTQAVAGNNGPAGLIGDVIQTLLPYSDDLLLFGCDHSIYQMAGNPMAGGRVDTITNTVGMAWGRPWCKNDVGVIYFFGSRGGVYRMAPGNYPERITETRIDERLAEIDVSTHVVKLTWNDRKQGVDVWVSPLNAATATTHYFYDERADAWLPTTFDNANHNPLAVHVFDGDDPDDRVTLLGTRDGYILKDDLAALDDDGTAIDSYVYLGPLLAGGGADRFLLDELQATLGVGSGDVTFEVFDGDSAEAAYNKTSPRFTGTWSAGRNRSDRRRAVGHAIYLKLSHDTSGEGWSMEQLLAAIRETGPRRGRDF